MQHNRFVIIGAGTVVTALLIFVASSMPRRGRTSQNEEPEWASGWPVDVGHQR
jgi:hypothetical protein